MTSGSLTQASTESYGQPGRAGPCSLDIRPPGRGFEPLTSGCASNLEEGPIGLGALEGRLAIEDRADPPVGVLERHRQVEGGLGGLRELVRRPPRGSHLLLEDDPDLVDRAELRRGAGDDRLQLGVDDAAVAAPGDLQRREAGLDLLERAGIDLADGDDADRPVPRTVEDL